MQQYPSETQQDSTEEVSAKSLAGWAFKPVKFRFGGELKDGNIVESSEDDEKIVKNTSNGRIIVDGSSVHPRELEREEEHQPAKQHVEVVPKKTMEEKLEAGHEAKQFYQDTLTAHPSKPIRKKHKQVKSPPVKCRKAAEFKYCNVCQLEVEMEKWTNHVRGITHLHAMEATEIPQIPTKKVIPKQEPVDTNKTKMKPGQEILENMGWKPGQALGAEEQGIKEPIKVVIKQDKRGLGKDNGPVLIVGENRVGRKGRIEAELTPELKQAREAARKAEISRRNLLRHLKK